MDGQRHIIADDSAVHNPGVKCLAKWPHGKAGKGPLRIKGVGKESEGISL